MWFIGTSKPITNTTIKTTSECCHPSPCLHVWHRPHNITSHHIRSVESREINPSPVGLVLQPQPLTSLCSGRATAYIPLYSYRLLDHASIQIVSVIYMRSNPPHSSSWMACASTQPLPSWMLRVPMVIPGWCGFRQPCWRRCHVQETRAMGIRLVEGD